MDINHTAPCLMDADGDRLADPIVFQPETGTWTALLSASGYSKISTAFGPADGVVAPGDYDGDGLFDPGLYDAADGILRVWLSETGYQPASARIGGSGFVPVN